MSKISKIMAMFVGVGSLAFFAFSLVVWSAGPNWEAEIQHKDIVDGYAVAYSQTAEGTPQWAVTQRHSEQQTIDTTAFLPQAVIKARADLDTYQTTRTAALTTELEGIEPVQVQVDAQLTADKKAITERETEIAGKLDEVGGQVESLSQQFSQLSSDTEDVRDDARKRREDIIRLRSETDEVETDVFRLTAQRAGLANTLLQLKLNNRGLEQRNNQLKSAE